MRPCCFWSSSACPSSSVTSSTHAASAVTSANARTGYAVKAVRWIQKMGKLLHFYTLAELGRETRSVIRSLSQIYLYQHTRLAFLDTLQQRGGNADDDHAIGKSHLVRHLVRQFTTSIYLERRTRADESNTCISVEFMSYQISVFLSSLAGALSLVRTRYVH